MSVLPRGPCWLWPTESQMHWVPVFFMVGETAVIHRLVPWLRMSGTIRPLPLLPQWRAEMYIYLAFAEPRLGTFSSWKL